MSKVASFSFSLFTINMQFKTFSTFIVAAWLMAAVRSVDGKKKVFIVNNNDAHPFIVILPP